MTFDDCPAPLRLLFMGSDPIALPMLEAVSAQVEVPLFWVGVFTQPDRPVGRGQQVQANGVKVWAQGRGIPVFQPDKLEDDVLKPLAPDLVIVMAYGHILRDPVIQTPRLGTINLHASLLPSYRGASPIQTAVASGDSVTGVSLMRIVRKLDAGPVADVEEVRISPTDTALEVEKALSTACVPLVLRNLRGLAEGTLVFREQNDGAATFCRRLSKEDAALDFAKPARLVAARINGLNPWPGSSFVLRETVIKVGLAEAVEGPPLGVPGTVISGSSEALTVATSTGAVALLKLQRPGGKMLPAREFLRGFPIETGVVLPSTGEAPLVGTTPFKYAPRRKAE